MSSIMIVGMVSQVHTYTEAYQTGHFKNTSIKLTKKSFMVRFPSVSNIPFYHLSLGRKD